MSRGRGNDLPVESIYVFFIAIKSKFCAQKRAAFFFQKALLDDKLFELGVPFFVLQQQI